MLKKGLCIINWLFQGLLLSFIFLFIQTSQLRAEPTYTLTLPVIDLPYNNEVNLQNPSMAQSLNFTKGFYQTAHYALEEHFGRGEKKAFFSIIAFDVFSTWLPFSNSWMHEEWHRAVMWQYGIDSYNEVYEMEFLAETIAVSDVTDENLVTLKKEHPQDLIRLHTAGLESQNQLNLAIEKDYFFHKTSTYDTFLLLSNSVNNSAYLYTCASNESNAITSDILNDEGSNIRDRDFTGLDCNAWVYDLFRPDEPYTDRGIHPSGVGINRYITYSKLTTEEKQFLRTQHYLSYLNFVDPFLINKRWFNVNSSLFESLLKVNANLKHYLTPFGYSIDAHLFLNTHQYKILFTFHNYSNKVKYFQGATLNVISTPKKLGSLFTETDFSVSLWNQPKDLSFTTKDREWGGRVSLKSAQQWNKSFHTFAELAVKTNGWYAGDLYLSNNTNFIFGFDIPIGESN